MRWQRTVSSHFSSVRSTHSSTGCQLREGIARSSTTFAGRSARMRRRSED